MKQCGFSLVELSIVLVILGALTGGVLAGANLIRAAELRSVSTEMQQFVTASYTFKNKYFALPGDMSTATRFWGDNTSQCDDGNASNNGTPGTCNGDGDGILDGGSGGNLHNERFMFWNQLALAGLIEGSYDGIAGSNNQNHALIGDNVPASKLKNAGWAAQYLNFASTGGTTYNIPYDNHLVFGAQANGTTSGRALKPGEAWNIDNKADDGKPAYGKMIAEFWNDDCAEAIDGTATADDLASEYKISAEEELCVFRVRQLF